MNELEFNLITDLNYGCSICADEGCIKDLEEMLQDGDSYKQ